MKDNKQYMFWR